MPCLAFFLSPGCGPVIIGTANMLIADVWLLNRVSGLDKALYGGEGVRRTIERPRSALFNSDLIYLSLTTLLVSSLYSAGRHRAAQSGANARARVRARARTDEA
jgi:hypothetical protein